MSCVICVFCFVLDTRNLTVLFSFQVLLRVKENEIEYLHKEISCLRNEVQFLNTVLYLCVCARVLICLYR